MKSIIGYSNLYAYKPLHAWCTRICLSDLDGPGLYKQRGDTKEVEYGSALMIPSIHNTMSKIKDNIWLQCPKCDSCEKLIVKCQMKMRNGTIVHTQDVNCSVEEPYFPLRAGFYCSFEDEFFKSGGFHVLKLSCNFMDGPNVRFRLMNYAILFGNNCTVAGNRLL